MGGDPEMSNPIFGYDLISRFDILTDPVTSVRKVKRGLRFGIQDQLRKTGKKADGPMAFRTYAQSHFSPKDVFYKETPWIVGTTLPEWAILVRVEAEVDVL